jgi:hypothetical protein
VKFGLLTLFKERQGDDYMAEAVRACGEHVRLTHYGAWNFVAVPGGEVAQGPCPSFCLPCIKDHRLAGIEEIDRATAMALACMRQLVKSPQAV